MQAITTAKRETQAHCDEAVLQLAGCEERLADREAALAALLEHATAVEQRASTERRLASTSGSMSGSMSGLSRPLSPGSAERGSRTPPRTAAQARRQAGLASEIEVLEAALKGGDEAALQDALRRTAEPRRRR